MRTFSRLPLLLSAACTAGASSAACTVSASSAAAAPTTSSSSAGTTGLAAHRSAARRHLELATPMLVAPGAALLEESCAADTVERCNGHDDDCDGRIDEGCGFGSGPLQLTVAWAGEVDLDLYVINPGGETISQLHPRGASGGLLDHQGRGACDPQLQPSNIENVHWTSLPSFGPYRIELHYWGECNTGAGPVEAVFSASLAGKVIGAYRFMVAPSQRAEIASFRLRYAVR